MKKAAIAAGLILALTGCTESATYKDLMGVPAATPTKIEAYSNIDNHPNIVMVCIHGKAMMTTSRKKKPIERAEWWDDQCAEELR